MQRTRRGVLGVVCGASVAGLAGCLGVEGVEYPEDEEEPPDDENGGSSEVPNSELAAATRDVVDDTLWFAHEYDRETRAYLDAIGDVIAEIRDAREAIDEADAIEDDDVADRLETVGFEAADRAAEALEPHFSPRESVENRVERHVAVLRTFIPRDDIDRVIEELTRMETSMLEIGRRSFVDTEFSREPIHNRLLHDRLLPSPHSDDHDESLETTMIEIGVGDEFETAAKLSYDDVADDDVPLIRGSPMTSNARLDTDFRTELRARLGPVIQSAERTAELFFVFSERPEPGDHTDGVWIHDLGGPALYVQRYADADTAAEALDAALDGGETEGDEPIDPDVDRTDGPDAATHWYRFFHHEARGERYAFDDHAGVQYGYLVQAGEFLLAAGFSGDAWEERPLWQGTLADSWVVE